MGSDIPKCIFLAPDVCFQIDFYLLITLLVVDVVWVHVFPISVLHCFFIGTLMMAVSKGSSLISTRYGLLVTF
jgi:hypothetical protein